MPLVLRHGIEPHPLVLQTSVRTSYTSEAVIMAEDKGIEPSTLRWRGFQDRLSTLLAILLYSGRGNRNRTYNLSVPNRVLYLIELHPVIVSTSGALFYPAKGIVAIPNGMDSTAELLKKKQLSLFPTLFNCQTALLQSVIIL